MRKILKKIYRKAFKVYQPDVNNIRFMKHNPAYKAYEIGEGTYGFPKVYDWNDNTSLTIGKYCSFADNISIFLGGEHHSDFISSYPFSTFKKNSQTPRDKKSKGDVVIGNDVWVANNVIILSGINIGNGAIIGAGSVVTKPVNDYQIVAGNPARHIRYRFDNDIVNELLKIKWWTWSNKKIEQYLPEIMSSNIEAFVKNHQIK